jgi:hypothetical protein
MLWTHPEDDSNMFALIVRLDEKNPMHVTVEDALEFSDGFVHSALAQLEDAVRVRAHNAQVDLEDAA